MGCGTEANHAYWKRILPAQPTSAGEHTPAAGLSGGVVPLSSAVPRMLTS